MQFSILGVPFKCTKDMFTWEKAKWSFFVWWAGFWRSTLVAVLILFTAGIALVPISLGAQSLALIFLFSLGLFLVLVFAMAWMVFHSLYKKQYNSHDRQYSVPPQNIHFLSRVFLVPTFLQMFFVGVLNAMGVIIAMILVFLLVVANDYFGSTGATIMAAISIATGWVWLVAYVLLSSGHIFLHGGTWGFVPVRKQPKSDVPEVKS